MNFRVMRFYGSDTHEIFEATDADTDNRCHIIEGTGWLTDKELENWEKV